jgi:hypothetical protein
MISPQAPSDVNRFNWTTARCNRLLRPIVHRIATLRRLKNEALHTSAYATSSAKPVPLQEPLQLTKSRTRVEFGNPLDNKENDPDWVSGPCKKKKAGRHYSARSTSSTKIAAHAKISEPILQPGELSIPTPYLSKVVRLDEPTKAISDLSMLPPKLKTVGRPRIDQEEKKDILGARVSRTEDEHLCLQNLVKSFLELIDATNLQSPSRRGARSLLSTCCRLVPTFIADEEASQLLEDEKDGGDISAETYALIQDQLEIKEGYGWKHMREVVRAHGVQMIRGAIKEGLLPREISRSIIRHLLKPYNRRQSTKPSPLEAEILLTELIASETPAKLSECCSRNQFYAHSFNNAGSASAWVETGSSHTFAFRQFSNLLASQYIPVEWMATGRVVPLWKNVFKVFRDAPSEAYDAFKLLQAAVELGTGVQTIPKQAQQVLLEIPAHYVQQNEGCPRCPRPASGTFLACWNGQQKVHCPNQNIARGELATAFTNTLFSLSTILSSFAIATRLDSPGSQCFDPHFILWTLNSLSIDIVHQYCKANAVDSTLLVRDTSHFSARRSAFILASTLVTEVAGCHLGSGYAGADIDDLVHCIEQLDAATAPKQMDDVGIFESLPELVCSISQGASRISAIDSFASLRHLVRALNAALIPGRSTTPSTRNFLRRLALSSAIEFSNQNQAPEHLALVVELERTMTHLELSNMSRTPARSSRNAFPEVRRGLRWEEGICEWVAATPMSRHKSGTASIFLRPAQISLRTPLEAEKKDSNAAEPDYSPDSLSQPLDTVEGDRINISDMLLASSSPLGRSGLNSRLSDDDPPNRKASSTSASVTEVAAQRRWNVSVRTRDDTDNSFRPEFFSSNFSRNSSLGGNAVPKNLRLTKPKILKRTFSEAMDSSSEDELLSPKHGRKRSTVASTAEIRDPRRPKRGLLLRSISATTGIMMKKSRLSSGAEDDVDDDELSFA